MTEQEYKEYDSWPDWKLLEIVTERDGSQRKHLAAHLLELRRTQRVAMHSAHAAKWAAVAAIGSLIVSIISLFRH